MTFLVKTRKGTIAEIGEAITKEYNATPDGLYSELEPATSVAWEKYDKLHVSDPIAAGRQAMHGCMGVVYQKQEARGSICTSGLAATEDRDTGTGAFHSQQQLAEGPSCYRQYGAIISNSLRIAFK